MCLVAFKKMFRKIFSDVWLCSWKYYRKHIFYLLLTFSRLPNEYIISFIPKNTNKTQKKIIKSGQTKARLRSTLRAIEASHDASDVGGWRGAGDVAISSLSLSLSLFYFPRPEVIWSENGNRNDFPLFWLWNSINWKCFLVWPNLK